MKVGILGAASSKFGELWEVSPRKLVKETVKEAILNSGIKLEEIEAIYVANMLSGILGNQENLGAFFAEEIGLKVPAFRVEAACASGGMAVHGAVLSILSGIYKKVLVIGIEKMTDHKPEEISLALMAAGSDEERMAGLTFPGLYAILAQNHMRKYGTSEKELAAVAVKNHYHASFNPKAHFQIQINLEKVLQSAPIAEPLKLFDCSPISDGASCLVLAEESIAKKKNPFPVWITASNVMSDTLSLANRQDLTTLKAAFLAGQKAYRQAQVKPEQIDVAEIHDCFTIAEIIALEDLGFYKKGKAGKAIAKGEVTLQKSKKLVVNPSGGLKACGHPVGATGVKQIVEIVEQLRGKAGKRQVKNAKIGLTHNIGGSGAIAVIHILRN